MTDSEEAIKILAEIMAVKRELAALEVKYELLTEAPKVAAKQPEDENKKPESPFLPGVPLH